jgi:hypothetical protein
MTRKVNMQTLPQMIQHWDSLQNTHTTAKIIKTNSKERLSHAMCGNSAAILTTVVFREGLMSSNTTPLNCLDLLK